MFASAVRCTNRARATPQMPFSISVRLSCCIFTIFQWCGQFRMVVACMFVRASPRVHLMTYQLNFLCIFFQRLNFLCIVYLLRAGQPGYVWFLSAPPCLLVPVLGHIGCEWSLTRFRPPQAVALSFFTAPRRPFGALAFRCQPAGLPGRGAVLIPCLPHTPRAFYRFC